MFMIRYFVICMLVNVIYIVNFVELFDNKMNFDLVNEIVYEVDIEKTEMFFKGRYVCEED